MLLTITYRGQHTQDLGYLLMKNPDRAQGFELSFGTAYVFYPEVSDEKTTAALLLDIDYINLVKGKPGAERGGLFAYVNDRPYASTSFLGTAIKRVFGTAMTGRCDARPELANTPIDLEAYLAALPVHGEKGILQEVFAPLGYEVTYEEKLLDERFPEWGMSDSIDLTLRGTVTLKELLNHLYVLIPVFDGKHHYYMNESEIEKILRHGEGWLSAHPAKERIVRRYFRQAKSFADTALDTLSNPIDADTEKGNERESARGESLDHKRLQAVYEAVKKSGATSVIDLGCGEGKLLALLMEDAGIAKVTGMDVSVAALEKAKKRLHADTLNPHQQKKLTLMQGSLVYRDDRIAGYDAACVVEVIEHIEPERLLTFEKVLFRDASPRTIILTTPNRDYNENYAHLKDGKLRHEDHRFEWSRDEFRSWSEHICQEFGWKVEHKEIGDASACGAPTQMGVFTKCE